MTISEFIDRYIDPTGELTLQPHNVTLACDLRAACKEHGLKYAELLETIRALYGYEHRPRGLVVDGKRRSIYLGFRLRTNPVQFDGGRGEIAKALTRVAKLRPEAYSLFELRLLTDMPELTPQQIYSASRSRSFVVARIVAPDENDRGAEHWFLIVLAGSPSEDDVRHLQRKHPHHQDQRRTWEQIKAKR